jgi:hypothetical protein
MNIIQRFVIHSLSTNTLSIHLPDLRMQHGDVLLGLLLALLALNKG